MNFKDIDFSAIANMLNSMSDEQKAQMADMADNVMREYANRSFDAQEDAAPEEETDFYTALHLDEDACSSLPGNVLDALEAGHDMETYYEDDEQADLSPAALMYLKALLFTARAYAHDKLLTGPAAYSTLAQYSAAFASADKLEDLYAQYPGLEEKVPWMAAALSRAGMFLSRAEYDTLRKTDLESLKELLFTDGLLLRTATLFEN